jgi:ABC-type siderophore export system fused ATPase/permease subunit
LSVWRKARERIGSVFGSPLNATLRRLLTDQGFKHWKGYLFAFAMMGLIALTTSLSAWIIGRIVDKIFVGRDLNAVWEITAAIVAIYTVKGLATYGQQVVMSRVGNNIVADVQRRIFDQMLRMKVSYYSRSHSSEFIARQAFIAQSASNVLSLVITTLSRDALTIVGLVIVMVSQDPLLSLLALMFVPLAAVGVRKIGIRVRKIMASEFQGAMQMMESLAETAQGIRIVKAFTLENFMRERQAQAIASFESAANKLARVSSRTSPIMESLGGFAIAAVVLYSGYTVIIRGNPPGSLFSFITSVIMLYEPMKRVARLHVDVSSGLFGVSMLFTFLDERDYEEDAPQSPDLEVTNGRIEFRDVVFGYRPQETVLHAISFVAEAGRTTALVGRSGGGKSTVMSLIPRLYEVGAPADRLCRAGEFPVQGFGARQHRDGQAGRQRGGNRRRRQGGLCARLHHRLRARVRLALRRARHAAFRRTAPAHRNRPRLSEGRADHPARRGDFGARFRVRAGDPEGAAHAVRGPHHDRHRPPPVDGGAGRRDLCRRSRPYCRARPPRRTVGDGPHVHSHRPDAVSPRRGLRARGFRRGADDDAGAEGDADGSVIRSA